MLINDKKFSFLVLEKTKTTIWQEWPLATDQVTKARAQLQIARSGPMLPPTLELG